MLLALQSTDEVGTSTVRTLEDPLAVRRPWWRSWPVADVETVAVEPVAVEPRPGTVGFVRWAAQLGERIDEHGLAATSGDVEMLVAIARRLGVASVATGVLADPSHPTPARHRAFAHVVAALVETPAVIDDWTLTNLNLEADDFCWADAR